MHAHFCKPVYKCDWSKIFRRQMKLETGQLLEDYETTNKDFTLQLIKKTKVIWLFKQTQDGNVCKPRN